MAYRFGDFYIPANRSSDVPQQFEKQLAAYQSFGQQPGMGEAAAAGSALAGAGSFLSGPITSVINGAFGLGQSFVSAGANRDVARYSLEGAKYGADKLLEGTRYTADLGSQNFNSYLKQQKEMWNRDYTIAHDMGLYHPSQLANLGQPASTDIYKLGVGSVVRMPKTFKNSVFSI